MSLSEGHEPQSALDKMGSRFCGRIDSRRTLKTQPMPSGRAQSYKDLTNAFLTKPANSTEAYNLLSALEREVRYLRTRHTVGKVNPLKSTDSVKLPREKPKSSDRRELLLQIMRANEGCYLAVDTSKLKRFVSSEPVMNWMEVDISALLIHSTQSLSTM